MEMGDDKVSGDNKAKMIGSNGLSGEIAALTAAFLWAAASLMFGRLGKQLSPVVLNLAKGLFALLFIGLTLSIQSSFSAAPAFGILTLPVYSVICLLTSGAVGIGLGDTAYFSAINSLGARRALILETLAPPVSAVLAWIFLSERLSITAVAGIGLTLIGVVWVISERVPETQISAGRLSASRKGVWIALLAVMCQAAGAVLSRAALANTAVDPLASTLIRLLSGLVFMGVLIALRPQQLGAYRPDGDGDLKTWQTRWQRSWAALRTPKLLLAIAAAAFFATYLGIWLQQIALKYTATGIAQSLLATSPLFVLPMVAALGDRVSWRSVCGATVALSGVWLLFYVG